MLDFLEAVRFLCSDFVLRACTGIPPPSSVLPVPVIVHGGKDQVPRFASECHNASSALLAS